MEENTEVKVDQHKLAEDLSKKIKFEFRDYFLVKPLDPIMVTKTFTKPKDTNEPIKDDNGVEAVDFNEVETETKQVESDFKKGVVLKVPASFYADNNVKDSIKVGDVIVFSATAGRGFDLLKDSKLIRYYDIIAVEE